MILNIKALLDLCADHDAVVLSAFALPTRLPASRWCNGTKQSARVEIEDVSALAKSTAPDESGSIVVLSVHFDPPMIDSEPKEDPSHGGTEPASQAKKTRGEGRGREREPREHGKETLRKNKGHRPGVDQEPVGSGTSQIRVQAGMTAHKKDWIGLKGAPTLEAVMQTRSQLGVAHNKDLLSHSPWLDEPAHVSLQHATVQQSASERAQAPPAVA
eukprot:349375-Rhodomonas_salina.1